MNYIENSSELTPPQRQLECVYQLEQKLQQLITEGQVRIADASPSRSVSKLQQLMKLNYVKHAQKQQFRLQQKLEQVKRQIKSLQQQEVPQKRQQQPNAVKELLKFNSMRKQFAKEKQRLAKLKQLQKQKKQAIREQSVKQHEMDSEARELAKRKQIESRLELRKALKQQQEAIMSQRQSALKRIKQTKYLNQELEQRFKAMQAKEEQQYSLKLKEARKKVYSVDLTQLRQHQQQFQQKKQVLLEQKIQQRREEQKRIEQANKQMNYFRIQRPLPEQEEDQAGSLTERRYKYAELVKQQHLPAIDPSKRKELEQRVQSVLERQRQIAQLKSKHDRKTIGIKYLHELADLKKPVKKVEEPQVSQKPVRRYINYLTREKRTNSSWSEILRTKDPAEMAVKVYFQSQKIEEKLALKQKVMKHSRGASQEVDNQYFAMVQAKINALQALT